MVVTNDKGFFLTLDPEAAPARLDLPTAPVETEESQATPEAPSAPTLLVAPSDQVGVASAPPKPAPTPVAAAVPTAQAPDSESSEPVAAPISNGLTTAEAIAAELAATEAAQPEMTLSTYAPDNLVPGSALSQRRRAPGAAVKNFRNMAEDLFKS